MPSQIDATALQGLTVDQIKRLQGQGAEDRQIPEWMYPYLLRVQEQLTPAGGFTLPNAPAGVYTPRAPGTTGTSPLDSSALQGYNGPPTVDERFEQQRQGLASQPNIAGKFSFGGGMLPAAGKGIMEGIKKLIENPEKAVGLAGVIAGLTTGNGSSDAQQGAERLNQITEQRMRRVDPLHQAVTQLAWGRLPMNARDGIAPPTYQALR